MPENKRALELAAGAVGSAQGLPHREMKAAGAPRYGFVDLLRGFALVVMIETHVVNAYLPRETRESALFFWLSFVNGLVAPSYLFASGFSLILQARRKWDDFLRIGPAFGKHLRRLGFILLVAYYMHLPYFGLSRFLTPQGLTFWKSALQVDVLHCIVVSLLLVDALILLTRRPALLAWTTGALALAASLATPWIWKQDFIGRVPLSLAMFLNPHGVSLFPVFPWLSFLLAGSCAAVIFLEAVGRGGESRFMSFTFWGAAAVIPAALFARTLPLFSAWNENFYRTSPFYVLIRLACVVMLCAGLYFMEKRFRWVPAPIRLAGQESLIVYGAHLLLIYSILRQPPIANQFGKEAGYPVCIALSAALIILMLLLAWLWHNWKRNYPRSAKLAPAALAALNIAIFVLR